MTIAAERMEVSAESLVLTHDSQDSYRASSHRARQCSFLCASRRRLCVAGVLVSLLGSSIMCILTLGPLLSPDQSSPGPLESTDRPIIGILTIPMHAASTCGTRRRLEENSSAGVVSDDPKEETSCFSTSYAQWLMAAGARVVPIRYDLPAQEMERLMRSVNGLLFTGGDVDLRDHGAVFTQAAKRMFEHVLETNRQGTHFPLWGTCIGFENLGVLVGGTEVLQPHTAKSTVTPIDFTAAADDSRLFGAKGSSMSAGLISGNIRKWFQTKNVTVHYHHTGISPDTFESNSKLKKFYNVLATGEDGNGQRFVSAIEARDFPIYGSQFHPERPQFQFKDLYSPKDLLNHGREAIACNSYLAQAFVGEARRNKRNFSTDEEEQAALIDNYEPRGVFSLQNFFFPKP